MTKIENITKKLARIHADTLYALTRTSKWFIHDKHPEYEQYYERIVPIVKGEYPCPVCTIRHNLLNDLASGRVDIPTFIAHGEEYSRHVHTSAKDEKLGELRANVLNLYGIDLKVYFEFTELHQRNALATFRTDPSLLYHLIDPIVYFGLLILHHPTYVGSAAHATSESAIKLFFQTYHRLLPQEGDLLAYVQRNYKLTQEERILSALNLGEKLVAQIMDEQKFTRWDALTYCVDFGVVPDLYILACQEFKQHGEKLLELRNRLRNFADNWEDPKIQALKATIKRVQRAYYDFNVRTYEQYEKLIPAEKKRRRAPKRGDGKPNLKQRWHDAGM